MVIELELYIGVVIVVVVVVIVIVSSSNRSVKFVRYNYIRFVFVFNSSNGR